MRIGFVGGNEITKQYYSAICNKSFVKGMHFVDQNIINARSIIKNLPLNYFENEIDLIKNCDMLVLCAHHKNAEELVIKSAKMGNHLLIANPFVLGKQTLKQLQLLSNEAGVKIQNAWSEKYNSAFMSAIPFVKEPVFIDVARLAQYSPSNSKLSVVNDLLLKDIEWVLSIANSNIRKISANALSVISSDPDFINAKLEFDNGCIVNLTASRVSELSLRKARVYNDKSVLFIDFLEKQLKRSYKKSSFLEFEEMQVEVKDDTVNQFDDFFESLENGKEPESNLSHMIEAKEVIEIILEKIRAKTSDFISITQ